MKLDLRTKIILPLIVFAGVIAIYVYIVPYKQALDFEKNDINNDLNSNLKSLAIPLTAAMLENDLSNIYATLDETLDKNPGWFSLRLYNKNGVLIYPLEEKLETLQKIEHYMKYESKVIYQGGYLGNLVLHADFDFFMEKHLSLINHLFKFIIAVFIVLIFFIGFGLEYFIRKPVSNLAKVSGQLANGNFDAVLPSASHDEVGQLINSFDQMRHSLSKSKHELENQKSALDLHSMVCVADEEERVIHVNSKMCVIGAYKMTDIVSQNMFAFLDDSMSEIKENILLTIRNGKTWSGQLTNKKKNGSLYYTEATIVPFVDGKGKPYKYINIQTDISLRIYSENMANTASERIKHLLSYSSTIIYSRSMSSENEINYISENVKDVLGHRQEDILSSKIFWENNIHPDDVERLNEHMRNISGKELQRVEYRVKHKEDRYIWIVDRFRLVHDDEGMPVDIVGSLSDITHRVNAENEMESRVMQQAAVSSLGRQALQNKEVDELFNDTVLQVKELLNLDLCLVLQYEKKDIQFSLQAINGFEDDVPATLKVAADLSTHAGQTLAINSEVLIEDLQSDTRFEKPNFLTELGITSGMTVPIPGRDQLYGVLCIYSNEHRLYTYDDVQFIRSAANVLGLAIERKLFEDELYEHQYHLEEMVDEQTKDLIVARDAALVAERSMSTFLSNMSHELRTPLHGILSFSRFGIKKHETATREKLHEYFTEIADSGETLLTLVSTLLDLSKLKAGKMIYDFQNEDIINTASKVIREYSALCIEKDITINFQHSKDTILCDLDNEKIGQVIRNLLSNAFKFSKPSSLIQISIEQIALNVNVNVIDQGVGIPGKEVESVFKPFTQSSLTSTNAGGTGLGLSICKEIVENGHNGWIKAISKEGEGTSFIFSFPLKKTNVKKLLMNENR